MEWLKTFGLVVVYLLNGRRLAPSWSIRKGIQTIILQSVGLKIFISCHRDSIFDFLKINGFVEIKIHKGFTHKVSGTLEHSAMVRNIINKVWIKQRSLVITSLDLKNTFGEYIIIWFHPFLPTIMYLKASHLYSQVFIQISKHLLSQFITDLQLSLSAGESWKVIASALVVNGHIWLWVGMCVSHSIHASSFVRVPPRNVLSGSQLISGLLTAFLRFLFLKTI